MYFVTLCGCSSVQASDLQQPLAVGACVPASMPLRKLDLHDLTPNYVCALLPTISPAAQTLEVISIWLESGSKKGSDHEGCNAVVAGLVVFGRLKKVSLCCSATDLTPLTQLKELEELRGIGTRGPFLDVIASLSRLVKLDIFALPASGDISLQSATLEFLSVYDVKVDSLMRLLASACGGGLPRLQSRKQAC